MHPERGAAAQHRHRRGGVSARAGADGRRCSREFVQRVRRADRRRLLRHDAGAPRGDRRGRASEARRGAQAAAADAASTVAARQLGDARDHAAPGSAAAARRRARQLAGLAQGEAAAARRRLRGHPRRRARAGGVGRARARRLRRAHRARRRGRADVEGRQAALDERRDAAHDRLDRGDVIEAALEHIPGRAIVNSINMENGRKRIDAVVPLAKKHGAALVALTIDEIGMAKTRERKLEVARKIYDIVVGEYGLRARRPDLRRADVHARDRRRGVDRLGERDDRGHPPDQARAARRLHDPRRLERELRPRARGARACSTRCSCTTACRRGSTRRS